MTEPKIEGAEAANQAEVVRDGAAAGAALKLLFPALFAGGPRPIKLRIQSDIEARVPGKFTKQALTAFLRRHTATTAYLKVLTQATHRFDLDGQAVAELSEEHRTAARAALEDRRARLRERDAEMEAARKWRAELLRDWGQSSLSRANFCALKGVTDSALDALLAQAKTEAEMQPAKPAQTPARPHVKGRRAR